MTIIWAWSPHHFVPIQLKAVGFVIFEKIDKQMLNLKAIITTFVSES